MSDNVSPSAYNAPGALAPESDNFNCQFRLLLMRVFMDNLGKEQVLKFHFLCRMPEKLRDHEANSPEFRFEILKYVEHQLMHEWTRTPSSLQTLLVDVGRTDLSLELGQLVARYQSEIPDAERFPVEETQEFTAANISPRRQPPLANIPEEASPHEDVDKHASLKRTPSNVSERSSGYYSNPRSSEPRFSQLSMLPEPITEVEEEMDNVPYTSIKQSGYDKDEGLCLDIDCTGEFTSSLNINDEDRSTSGSDSSTLGSDSGDSPTRTPFRDRAYQYFGNRRSSKQKDSVSELDESRERSASLPTDCRKVGNRLRSTAVFGSSNSSIDSSTSGSTCDSQSNSLQRQPVETELNITGSMKIDVKDILKSVDKKDCQPVVSREFPSKKHGYRGTSFEIRFIPSDFSEKNASLYVDVAQSYLKRSSKKEAQFMVKVQPMTVNVTLLSSDKDGECGACSEAEAGGCCPIKSVSFVTELKRIDSRSKTKEKGLIASFPQVVSHDELKQLRAGHSLVIRVNMSV